MNTIAIILFYILYLFSFIVGTFFKIMHWEYGKFMIGLSFLFLVVYILLIIIGIARSHYASSTVKAFWISGYTIHLFLVLPVAAALLPMFFFRIPLLYFPFLVLVNIASGLIYLLAVSRIFYPKRSETDKIEFDSF